MPYFCHTSALKIDRSGISLDNVNTSSKYDRVWFIFVGSDRGGTRRMEAQDSYWLGSFYETKVKCFCYDFDKCLYCFY